MTQTFGIWISPQYKEIIKAQSTQNTALSLWHIYIYEIHTCIHAYILEREGERKRGEKEARRKRGRDHHPIEKLPFFLSDCFVGLGWSSSQWSFICYHVLALIFGFVLHFQVLSSEQLLISFLHVWLFLKSFAFQISSNIDVSGTQPLTLKKFKGKDKSWLKFKKISLTALRIMESRGWETSRKKWQG